MLPASSFYDSIELKRTSTKRKEAKTQREGNRDVVVSEKKKAVSRIKAVQKKAAVPVAAAATSSIKKGERAAKKTTTNADNDDNDPSRKSLNFSQLMELASKQPAMTSNGRQETTKTKDAEKVRRKSDDPRTFSSSAPKRKATLVSETLNKGFSTATSSSSSSSGGNERRQRVSMTTLPWRRTVPRRRESNYYDDDDDDDDDDDGFIEKGGEEFDYSSIIRDLSGYDKSKYVLLLLLLLHLIIIFFLDIVLKILAPTTWRQATEKLFRKKREGSSIIYSLYILNDQFSLLSSARLARLEDLEEERKEREREKRKLAAAAAAKKKRKT